MKITPYDQIMAILSEYHYDNVMKITCVNIGPLRAALEFCEPGLADKTVKAVVESLPEFFDTQKRRQNKKTAILVRLWPRTLHVTGCTCVSPQSRCSCFSADSGPSETQRKARKLSSDLMLLRCSGVVAGSTPLSINACNSL